MPLVVGTAGHIDHGKTWLVRALTGKDTDRLPEEHERGISIDLGYAPLELPGGLHLSLVDVPGHERFVRNMVAGATGVDLFLLVIDAAEGARPQTHEHLAILRLLGIPRGVVTVTKADAVEPEQVELAVAEASELVPEAEVVAVSAKTGAGLDGLRAALGRTAEAIERPERFGARRLWIDRAFSLRGIGTVVTGTLWSGSIAAGDFLRLEPGGRAVRVRSVQVHDRPVEVAEAGQRVAVNLPAIERGELRRGNVLVAPGYYPVTYRLDAILEELEPVPPAELGRGLAAVEQSGDWAYRPIWLEGVRAIVRERLQARAQSNPLDPGIPFAELLPNEPWAPAILPLLHAERRNGKAFAPGASASLGDRAEAAARLEAELADGGLARVEDAELAEYLESAGKLHRVGDGFAVSPELYARGREALLTLEPITLAAFRDALGISRRAAQLLLERYDSDGLTRRVGDERVLRASARQRT